MVDTEDRIALRLHTMSGSRIAYDDERSVGLRYRKMQVLVITDSLVHRATREMSNFT
jgi:hypothetical protein